MLEEQLSQKRKQNADALFKQSRHIPKLLQSQILCHLVQQFLFSRNEKFMHHTDSSKAPLIQRFHGALLFVDISGFTSLSLKLDVDNLKNHINRYFTKMLNIVEKWGGDVIKFAGDALFIVWPTDIHAKGINLNNLKKEGGTIRGATIRSMMLKIGGGTGPAATANTEESRFAAAAKIAVEKAVACGLEICSECSHYEILLSGTAPNRGGMLQKFVPTWLIPAKVSPENSNVAYLDVHAGVSVGLMAAVDIGHRNRREYFLLGDPIKYAAEAEGKASKGEIVLCPRSHFILHRTEKDSLPTLYGDVDKEDKLEGHTHSHDHKKVPCGCMRLEHNYHCITKLNVSSLSTNTTTLDEKEAVETTPASPPKFTRGRSKSKLDLLISISETDADALMSRIAMELEKDLDKMLLVARPLMKRQFLAIVKKHLFPPVITAEDGEGSNKLTTQNPIQLTDEENIRLETTLSDLITSNLRDAFQCFVQQTLLDEVVKHVHDVVRDNYTFTREESMSAGITRETTLQSWMEYPLIHRSSEEEKLDINHLWMVYQTYEGPENQVKNKDSPDSPLKKQKSQGKLTRALSASVISDKAVKSAEIRTVIVLFMKVDGLDSNLLIDSSENRRLNGGGFARKPQNAFYDMYRFLDRTENEIASDNVLASRFQSCIEGIIESLSVYNGQLRQFIVDDKGTVAIGTFGLRGSLGSDNAASAIEAAQQIIDKLNVLKLSVSIGITTGRAYCGLVGSQNRHEFAVMGPSTNLSARLMGKTAPNSITCDFETKNSDRIHSFESTGEVTAKGYAQPVATYVPILKNSTIANASGGAAMNFFNQFSMSALVPTSRKMNLLKRFQLSDHNKSYRHKNSNQKLNSLQDNTRNDEDYEYDGIPQFKEFIESSFFLPNDMNSILSNIRNSLRPPRQIKLYERNRNLISILSFLFPKDSNNNNSRGSITSSFRKKTITTTTATATTNLFDLTTPNRMITCCGTSGLGKTALLKSFTSKLSSFIMNKPKIFNLFIIQNRTKGINSKIPFHSWKIILMELLKIISQQSMNKANHANNNASKARSIRMVATVQKPDYHELLNSLLSEVSFKLESFTRDYIYQLFGLSSVNHIDLESIEEKLTNSKAEFRSIALALFQLIQIMIKKLDKLLFLCIDDVQYFDGWSIYLLHYLWKNGTGVVILSSFNISETNSSNCMEWTEDLSLENDQLRSSTSSRSHSSAVASKNKNKIEIIQSFFHRFIHNTTTTTTIGDDEDSDDRFTYFELLPLRKITMMEYLIEYFELDENNNPSMDFHEFEKIVIASGGIPLYAMELMKSLMARYNNQQQQQEQSDIHLHLTKGKGQSGITTNPQTHTTTATAAAIFEGDQVPSSSAFNHRIEEVIYFRLDKLDPTVQSLLKAASVAASRSSNFTLEMVSHLLKGQQQNNPSVAGPSTNSTSFLLGSKQQSTGNLLLNQRRGSRLIREVSFSSSKKEGGAGGNQSPSLVVAPLPMMTVSSTTSKTKSKFLSVSDALFELVQAGIFLQIIFPSKEANTNSATNLGSSSNNAAPAPLQRQRSTSFNKPTLERSGSSKRRLLLLQQQEEQEELRKQLEDDEKYNIILNPKLIEENKMEFEIPIEQSAIYNLLIDEQKEYFHEKLGFFWSNKFSNFLIYEIRKQQQLLFHTPSIDEDISQVFHQSKTSTAPTTSKVHRFIPLSPTILEERLEEAYHWEKSFLFPNGILAYMAAATHYKSIHNEIQWVCCIKSAFKLFQLLENDINHPFHPIPLSEEILSFLLKIFPCTTSSPTSSSSSSSQSITAKEIETFFQHHEEHILQVLIYLEGFLDYLPLFIQLFLNVLDIAIMELDDCQVIEYLIGANISFILTFYYCHFVIKTWIDYGTNDDMNPNDTKEEENKKNDDASKCYYLHHYTDLKFLDKFKNFQKDKVAILPITSFTSSYSLKNIYEIYNPNLFIFNSLKLEHFFHSIYFAHFYSFARKKFYSNLLIQRKYLLVKMLDELAKQSSSSSSSSSNRNDDVNRSNNDLGDSEKHPGNRSIETNKIFIFKIKCMYLLYLLYFPNHDQNHQKNDSILNNTNTLSVMLLKERNDCHSLNSMSLFTLLPEILQTYREYSEESIHQIIINEFSFNFIPMMLKVIAMELFYSGYYSFFLDIFQLIHQNSLAYTNQMKMIQETNSNCSPLIMFRGYGLGIIHQVLLCLIFDSPQYAYISWQDYLISFIDKDQMMKIFPYSWKRMIDSVLKQVFLLSKGLLTSSSSSSNNANNNNNNNANSLLLPQNSENDFASSLIHAKYHSNLQTMTKDNKHNQQQNNNKRRRSASPIQSDPVNNVHKLNNTVLSEIQGSMNQHFLTNFISYESLSFILIFCQFIEISSQEFASNKIQAILGSTITQQQQQQQQQAAGTISQPLSPILSRDASSNHSFSLSSPPHHNRSATKYAFSGNSNPGSKQASSSSILGSNHPTPPAAAGSLSATTSVAATISAKVMPIIQQLQSFWNLIIGEYVDAIQMIPLSTPIPDLLPSNSTAISDQIDGNNNGYLRNINPLNLFLPISIISKYFFSIHSLITQQLQQLSTSPPTNNNNNAANPLLSPRSSSLDIEIIKLQFILSELHFWYQSITQEIIPILSFFIQGAAPLSSLSPSMNNPHENDHHQSSAEEEMMRTNHYYFLMTLLIQELFLLDDCYQHYSLFPSAAATATTTAAAATTATNLSSPSKQGTTTTTTATSPGSTEKVSFRVKEKRSTGSTKEEENSHLRRGSSGNNNSGGASIYGKRRDSANSISFHSVATVQDKRKFQQDLLQFVVNAFHSQKNDDKNNYSGSGGGGGCLSTYLKRIENNSLASSIQVDETIKPLTTILSSLFKDLPSNDNDGGVTPSLIEDLFKKTNQLKLSLSKQLMNNNNNNNNTNNSSLHKDGAASITNVNVVHQ